MGDRRANPFDTDLNDDNAFTNTDSWSNIPRSKAREPPVANWGDATSTVWIRHHWPVGDLDTADHCAGHVLLAHRHQSATLSPGRAVLHSQIHWSSPSGFDGTRNLQFPLGLYECVGTRRGTFDAPRVARASHQCLRSTGMGSSDVGALTGADLDDDTRLDRRAPTVWRIAVLRSEHLVRVRSILRSYRDHRGPHDCGHTLLVLRGLGGITGARFGIRRRRSHSRRVTFLDDANGVAHYRPSSPERVRDQFRRDDE